MEILVNNGHNVAADEPENVCLSGAFPVENGAVSITDYIPATDNVRDSGDLHLEDESMTVNSKKRAFDEDPNGLQSPSKKLAVRSSPESLVDAVLFSSSLAEAMVIDTTWEESGEKELDNLPMPGFPEQIPLSLSACTSIPAPSPEAVMQVGEPECSETAQEVPVVQESPETSLPVNSNVDETKIEEDLIEFHSAQLESIEMEPVNGFTDPFKMMQDEGVVEKEEESLIADDVSNGLNDSLGLMKEEVVVEKEEESLMLEDFSKDSHVIFKTGVQVVPNEALEERAVAGMDMETSVAETVTDGGLPQSSPTGVNLVNSSVLHVAGASPTSGDDVSASEVQRMPMSSDSHTPQAFEGMKESDVTDSAPRSVNDDEAGVGDGNEINEVDELQMEKVDELQMEKVDALQMEKVDELQMEKVDELQMEKVDAAKALELKMVEVIMQSTDFVGRNDGSLNPLSDPTLIVHEQEDENGGEDTMIGLCDEDKFADLFEPVVQLPEHPEGTNGFLSETLDIEGLRNGQASEDLHLQHERHAKIRISRSQDPADQHVPPNKDLDFSELSGIGKGDSNMDRQFSEVLVPSGVTSTQPQSSGLKAQQKMKEHGEIATKSYPNFAAGRTLPVKEILLKEAPASAKLLLASGLLDGHYVRYLGRGGHVMLTGIIREGGVLCDCSSCKGLKVVNVSAFEKHAGSSARHPSDFIFLENGKCLKDILEIGWNSSKQDMNVMEVLKTAIGEIGGENIKVRSQENPIVMNQSAEKKLRPSPEAKPRIPLDTRPRLPHDSKPSLPQEMKPKLPLPLPQELKPKVPQETKPSLHSDMNLKLPQEMKPNLSQEFNAKMPLEVKSKLPPEVKPRVPQDMKPRLPQEVKPRLPYDTKPRSTIEVKLKGSEGRATQPRDRAVREKESVSPPALSRETSGANLHKALFLPGGLEDDTELGYYVKGQKFQSGVKRGAGILCSCCEQVISCSLFEQHAGWGSRRNPYTSIYLADGRSLHDAAQSLIVEQTVKQEGITPTKIEHLDQCVECGDSVDLLLCTGCPNAYHQDCLGLVDSSTGEFFCPDCQEQRFGGTKDRRRSLVRRRSHGAPKTLLTRDRVTGRSTRLLEVPEAVVLGGCVFCKSGEFAKSGFGPLTTLLCDQCEREYHVGCLKQHGLEDLKELPDGEWFCGQDCKHIHTILSLLVSNGPEPLADSVISKVLKSQPRLNKAEVAALQPNVAAFEWQLLHGRGGDPLNGKTLAEAVQIFAECFDPIADGRSGGDLIPLMVYRRSIRDQDFGGIYCVVLKQDDKVVSTALIRVFGRQLAELPLLATNPLHQGQGHCKALLLSIERLLGVLRVQRLALPAAEGAEGIWLNKFGFRRMLEDQVQDFHTNLNMMIFTGSIMLEKEIPPLEINTRIRKA